LLEGGKKAVEASTDPMIQLAQLIDGPARKVRTAYEDKVREPSRQVYAVMADIRARIKGGETYPDATGSLRLSFGPVRPPSANAAQFATIKDLFQYLYVGNRTGEMPVRWASAQNRLVPDTRIW